MTPATVNAAIEERRAAAVEEGLRVRSATGPRPASCRRASVRTLPAPFQHYFSITSDCDAPHLRRWQHIGEIVREDFALPIADSLFVSWPVRRGERHRHENDGFSKQATVFDRARFVDRNGPLIRRFHRGWFDVIHGWSQRLTIRIADDFVLRAPQQAAWSFAARVRRRLTGAAPAADCRRVRFVAPPSWQQFEPPRYLYFRYAMPIAEAGFQLVGWVGKEMVFNVVSHELFDPHHRFVPLPALVDLYPLVGNDPKTLLELEIEFRLIAVQPEASLTVEAPTLLSAVRDDVTAQLGVMTDFNMAMSTFSTHGIGMVFAVRRVADSDSTDRRWLADDPTNPVYFRDLLELAGVEFFNTFNNIAQEEVLPFGKLLRPVVFNDGTVNYDFHRYIHVPKNEHGDPDMSHFTCEGKPTNPSSADYLGYHIHAAMDGMTEPGSGVLLYTHAGVRCTVRLKDEERRTGERADRFAAIDDDSKDALREMADRYYNLPGNVTPDHRIWVAPTSTMVRLAQAMRGIREHTWYDVATNTVFIETWFDPVTKMPLPAPAKGFSDLRWLTFYVDDAETASVLVDGRPVTHLIRNRADETGRPSVTIADVRAPRIIVDDVDPGERGHFDIEHASVEMTDAHAFRGSRSWRLEGHGHDGRVVYRPRVPVDARNYQMLRIASRRLYEGSALALRIHLAGGETWSVADDEFTTPEACPLSRSATDDWCDTVIPFWAFTSAAAAAGRRAPPNLIEAFEFRVRGTMLVDCLELLRDCDGPPPADGCCIIGGKVEPPGAECDVVMTLDGEDHRTTPTGSGYYVFETRVPRHSIVRLRAVEPGGAEHLPARGAWHEIPCDDADFDIVIAGARPRRDRRKQTP